MKETLNIDVYQYPFSQENGYLSIGQDNFDLLIIKVELDDASKEKAIAKFLGLDSFRIIRANVAQNKNYAKTYQDFIQMLKLPESYINTMCNSKYTKHFYSRA